MIFSTAQRKFYSDSVSIIKLLPELIFTILCTKWFGRLCSKDMFRRLPCYFNFTHAVHRFHTFTGYACMAEKRKSPYQSLALCTCYRRSFVGLEKKKIILILLCFCSSPKFQIVGGTWTWRKGNRRWYCKLWNGWRRWYLYALVDWHHYRSSQCEHLLSLTCISFFDASFIGS